MGGTAPALAARYQIVILFCIAGTACASLLAACELAVGAVLDGDTHRVRREVLVPRDRSRGKMDDMVAAAAGAVAAAAGAAVAAAGRAGQRLAAAARWLPAAATRLAGGSGRGPGSAAADGVSAAQYRRLEEDGDDGAAAEPRHPV